MEQQNLLNEFSENQYELAGIGQRIVNYLIDVIVFYIVIIIIGAIMGVAFASSFAEGGDDSAGFVGITYLVVFAVFFGYYILLEGGKGKTLGKMVTKTKVVMNDGSPVSHSKAFIRTLCRLVPFEFLSVFGGGQMWHDKWTDTMVVKDK